MPRRRHPDEIFEPDDGWGDNDARVVQLGARSAPADRLAPRSLIEIMNLPPREYLIRGLLGAEEFSVWYGEPGCYKSFLMLYAALAVASGFDWFGRDVQRGIVVYVCAEGAAGIAKRLRAAIQRLDLDPETTKIFIITAAPDLCSGRADALTIAAHAERLAEEHGLPVRLVIIDTLSRAMPGANENAPEDMTAFIANIDTIRERTGAHVAVVHHSGKDTARGGRGHSALKGAADAEILVEKLGTISRATVMKSKDDEDGWSVTFNMELAELPGDPPASTLVLVPSDTPAPTSRPKLSPRERDALNKLHDLIADHGQTVASANIPPAARCVTLEAWRDALRKADLIDDGATGRQQWRRLKDSLRSAGLIAAWDDFIWTIQ